MSIILRPYQVKSIQDICNGFSSRNKQLCVLPTGSGKTVIFCNVIKTLKLKTLIIAHTNELLEQIYESCQKVCPEIPSSIYRKGNKDFSGEICIASIQSAIKPKNLEFFEKQNFDLLIIDECHRACAKSYRTIIHSLGINHKKLLGVTATPFRTDSQSLYEIFGLKTLSFSILDMIKKGYLVDYKGYRIKTKISLLKLRRMNGDFLKNKLSAVINVKNRNQLIVNEYIKISNGEKTLAFCSDIKHCHDLKKEFLDHGVSCESIDGKVSKTKRKEILRKFKCGEIKVLTNCNILTEGFDEPSITTLLMARPTCSKSLYIQMIGRGSRLYDGKKFCKVIEFTDNDFDVCALEDILETPQKRVKLATGECLSDYAERVKDELPEGDIETIVEYINPIDKTYGAKTASPWLINKLRQLQIPFEEPILESTANFLISRAT